MIHLSSFKDSSDFTRQFNGFVTKLISSINLLTLTFIPLLYFNPDCRVETNLKKEQPFKTQENLIETDSSMSCSYFALSFLYNLAEIPFLGSEEVCSKHFPKNFGQK